MNERKQAVKTINEYLKTNEVTNDVLTDLLDLCKGEFSANTEFDRDYWTKVTGFVKSQSRARMEGLHGDLYIDSFEEAYRIESPFLFESYLWYMEKDRENSKKFYLPRKDTLKTVVDDLQDLEDDKLDFYGLSMPPRVGKSTICIFFLSWVMGKKPSSHSAMGGHSGLLAKGFYQEILNLITSADYNFFKIFPDSKLEHKSSEEYTINLGKPQRFKTLTCRGIEGTWTGAVDISRDGYLYVDDLIRDREESLSPIRLENRYQDYLNVMVDRKNDGAKELMVGTRWNPSDPLGRNEIRLEDNPRARFRKIPALDENDHSNFNYTYNIGFSDNYYKEMRSRLDDNEWQAKYQQRPYVREGLLFPADGLNYFNGEIPTDGEYYVACAVDVAYGGSDSLSMPIGYVFENAVYIMDWVFDNRDKDYTRPKVADKIIEHKANKVQFEADNGGMMYAEDIDDMLRSRNYKTNITTRRASNRISKEAKIIQYAPDIKREFYFLEEKLRNDDYRKAMEELTIYTQLGRNIHDDSCDGLVQLYQFIDDSRVAKVEAFDLRGLR